MAVTMDPRSKWTDPRLDDLNKKVGDGSARLEKKIDAGFDRVEGRIGAVEGRIGDVENRVFRVEAKIDSLGATVTDLDKKTDVLQVKVDGLDKKTDGLTERVDAGFALLHSNIAELRKDIHSNLAELRMDFGALRNGINRTIFWVVAAAVLSQFVNNALFGS